MKFFTLLAVIAVLSSHSCIPVNSIPPVATNNDDYSTLTDQVTSSYRYITTSELRFLYKENYHDQDGFLEYKIYSNDHQIIQSNITQTQIVKYGVNKIKLPLIFTGTGFYTLEVVNEKGVKKYLTFQKA